MIDTSPILSWKSPLLCAVLLLLFSVSTAHGLSQRDIKRMAHKGNPSAQSYMAHLYTSGKGRLIDYKKARYWYNRIIYQHDADAKLVAHAKLYMGIMHENGQGGRRDYRKAMKYYRDAARQGFYDAHVGIGLLYATGRGVKKDYSKALHWWRLAAAKGHPRAPRYVAAIEKKRIR